MCATPPSVAIHSRLGPIKKKKNECTFLCVTPWLLVQRMSPGVDENAVRSAIPGLSLSDLCATNRLGLGKTIRL